MEEASRNARIAVIGAGIVGVCVAIELAERGHRVVLVEPDSPGGPQAASYGNGAFISPASILPMSFPGMWRRLPSYLADREGALVIRWRSLLPQLPWLARFLLAGATWPRLEATASHLHALLQDAPDRHAALAARAGLQGLIRRQGLIYAFRAQADHAAEARAWDLRRRFGVAMTTLDAEALAALVPALSRDYRFAIHVTGAAHCTDPGGYVAGLADHAMALGVTRITARVTGLEVTRGRLRGLASDQGPIACDRAVVAAGYGARGLARLAGDRIPMLAERGYHVQIADPRVAPAIPVMPQDGKMANTLTAHGLRASGQVELAAEGAPPDWSRADLLLRQLERCYPGLGPVAPDRLRRWQGNRPSTPDGLPVIGASARVAGLYYACGHGHSGLAGAPHSAHLLAEVIEGGPGAGAAAPFAPTRFGARRGPASR